MRTLIALIVCIGPVTPLVSLAEDPWADSVVSYSQTNGVTGFTDPTVALGPPVGISPDVPVNTLNSAAQVVSLGTPGGQVTLSFNTPITDDPNNAFGMDFIIYSNAFWVGNDPDRRFQEPGIVEISPDGTNWYLIPGSRNYDYTGGTLPVVNESAGGDNSGDSDILTGSILNPNTTDGDSGNDSVEYNWGYAELSPTLPEFLDNFVRPDDPHETGMTARSGGGDAFDIAWAIDQSGALANLTSITHVRISPFINRSMTVGLATPEIMAIADVAANVDTDSDGILDDFESRVLASDPARPENTLLPLEIPAIEGGSPDGTLLGTAMSLSGHSITLTSAGSRSSNTISTLVDLTTPDTLPGTISGSATDLSGALLDVDSTVTDFVTEEIDPAEIRIQYLPSEIIGLDESAFDVYRYDAGSYIQTGISNVQVFPSLNAVTFESQFSGTFAIASTFGGGKSTTTEIWVDFDFQGMQLGTDTNPYAMLTDGALAVSSGGTVHLEPGTSFESLSIHDAMTLVSTGGLVTIGATQLAEFPVTDQVVATPSGFYSRRAHGSHEGNRHE